MTTPNKDKDYSRRANQHVYSAIDLTFSLSCRKLTLKRLTFLKGAIDAAIADAEGDIANNVKNGNGDTYDTQAS